MNWDEYEERYGESREDFIEVEPEDECTYCGSTENVEERFYTINGYRHSELICSACLEEELSNE